MRKIRKISMRRKDKLGREERTNKDEKMRHKIGLEDDENNKHLRMRRRDNKIRMRRTDK